MKLRVFPLGPSMADPVGILEGVVTDESGKQVHVNIGLHDMIRDFVKKFGITEVEYS